MNLIAFWKKTARAELLWVAVLIIFIAIVYGPPLIQGKSLSLASQIGCVDLAFRDDIRAQLKPPGDWSIFLLHLPNEQIVSHLVKHFELPLWNPYQGCGVSLIGNIVARPFALLSWLAPMCDEPIYSCRLVLQIFLSSLAIGLVASRLRWTSFTKLWLALAWASAPIHLYQYELSSSSWFYPIALFFLVLAFTSSSLTHLYLAAAGLVFIVLSAHPETSFFSIGVGAFIAFAIVISETKQSTYRHLLLRLLLLAILTFALSSFVLIPFAEWLKHCFLYKAEKPTEWTFSGLSLLLSFFGPVNGSLTLNLGPFGLFLCALGMYFSTTTKARSCLITLVLSALVVFICRPGIFQNFLSTGILAWPYPVYALPLVYITGLLICGRGFHLLTTQKLLLKEKISALLICASGTFGALLSSNFYSSPKGTFQPFDLQSSVWQATLLFVFATILLIVAFVRTSRLSTKLQLYIFTGIICCATVGSNMLISGWRLDSYERLNLQCPSLIQSLVGKQDRLLVLGRYYLGPNLPSMFQIRDMRLFDATLPQRLVTFKKLCKANSEGTFNRIFNLVVGWQINMASVNLVATEEPVFDADYSGCSFDRSFNKEFKVAGRGLRIKLNNLYLNSDDNALLADLKVLVYKTAQYRYKAKLVSISHDCSTGQSAIVNFDKTGDVQLVWHSPTKVENPIHLAIEIDDTYKPDQKKFLLQLPEIRKVEQNHHRFKLLKIDREGHRLYRNSEAYPYVYFPDMVKQVGSEEEAYKTLLDWNRSTSKLAVVEDLLASHKQTAELEVTPEPLVISQKPNRVLIQYQSPVDRWLVWTNSYYPGWVARVDGLEKQLSAANINFTAVYVPAGNHRIEFSYEPKAFWYCLWFAIFAHTLVVSILVIRCFFHRSQKK